MAFYDEYKPFRNYMRRFDQLTGLVDVWAYALHIIDGVPLPPNYAVGKSAFTTRPLPEHLYPWDLELLAKELILNGGTRANRSLRDWNHLATAVNHIRRLDDVSFFSRAEPPDVMLELHRIAHRQFPWQLGGGVAPMIRAFKVFGQTAVETVVLRELGMTTRQYMLLGAAVGGHFRNQWCMSTSQDYGVLGISREASHAFFRRISISIRALKDQTAALQAYDSDWLYTWNPLEGTPLIIPDASYPDRIICPIPRYLIRRVSSGMFYDLIKTADFDNPFGNSFQAYVGDVLTATCHAPRFTILDEQSYRVGTKRFDGADWVLSDDTGHLFIEAKTKRLTVRSRTISDPEALNRDMLIIAKAVVQLYKNIVDALKNKTRWVNNGLPIFPLVLTLEDLFLFSPRVTELLQAHVARLIDEAHLSRQLPEEIPYTIASVSEFETVGQVVAQVGIAAVFAQKTQSAERSWSLLPFVNSKFRNEIKNVNNRLFVEDFARLLPNSPTDLI